MEASPQIHHKRRVVTVGDDQDFRRGLTRRLESARFNIPATACRQLLLAAREHPAIVIRDLGAAAYLVKPYPLEELIEKVHTLMSRARIFRAPAHRSDRAV